MMMAVMMVTMVMIIIMVILIMIMIKIMNVECIWPTSLKPEVAEVTRVTGVRDDHLQEAGPSK